MGEVKNKQCLQTNLEHPDGVTRKTCRACGTFYMRLYRSQGKFRENPDRYKSDILMRKAKSELYIQVRKGGKPKASQFKCADCGKQAQCYDHRDYRYSLSVEPVCVSCNVKRGPGRNRDMLIRDAAA